MENYDYIIKGANGLDMAVDLCFQTQKSPIPLVIFCHGFKGFKDWGAWHLVAKNFADNGFAFLKFNFSHNGTSIKNPSDFENLTAFSENNYSKELVDLDCVLDFVFRNPQISKAIDLKQIFLIGHSRGGGAALVKSLEDERIKKVATWASIDSYERFGTAKQIANWRQKGSHVYINGRTGQEMPIKFQFYEDYIKNKNRLNLKKTLNQLNKPVLVVHGTDDQAVRFQAAQNLVSWSDKAQLVEIQNANHVFGSSHPFLEEKLPKDLQTTVNASMEFFKKEC